MPQEQQKYKKGETKQPKYELGTKFEPAKVFSPGEAKTDDLKEDMDSARYKAQKGEGGSRRA